MSQWTHVLGTVRYDYIAQNIWCSDTQGRPKSYNPQKKLELLQNLYEQNTPEGSEGPIEIQVTNSERGPIVVLAGDLRDFGLEDVDSILYWLNDIDSEVAQDSKNEGFFNSMRIRDAIIQCQVEYCEDRIMVYKNDKFEYLMVG